MTAEALDIIQVLLMFFAFFSVCMPYPIFIYSFIVLNNGKWKNIHKNYVNYLYVAFLLCVIVSGIHSNGERYDIFASACFVLASIFAGAIMIKLLKMKEDICFFWSFISIIGHGIILAITCGIPPSDIAYPLIMSLYFFSGAFFCIPMIYATYRFLLLVYKRVKK